MLKQHAFLLLCLCFAVSAQAGLLEDDEARQQIQQLEVRVLKLEDVAKKLDGSVRQQTKSMLDLQTQIEALNTEIRNLRGQNEESAHGLQDAEKRQKDFYVDLDTRLRHFESAEATAKEAAAKAVATPATAGESDIAVEDRAVEAAYGLFKAGSYADAIKSFQDFINRYPDSVHIPNIKYWLGNSQVALKNYKSALDIFQGLLNDFPETPKAADALYGIAGCQRELKQVTAANRTLKHIIAKYPGSDAAAKAKKLLSAK